MKKQLKKICDMTIVSCMIMLQTMTIEAGTTYSTYNDNNFTSEWENTIYYYSDTDKKNEVGKMVYGYNTDFIKEDYCWTRNYKIEHQSGVCNSKGQYYGSKVNLSKWSKIEITHKGSSVQYSYWVNTDATYAEKLKENTDVK